MRISGHGVNLGRSGEEIMHSRDRTDFGRCSIDGEDEREDDCEKYGRVRANCQTVNILMEIQSSGLTNHIAT